MLAAVGVASAAKKPPKKKKPPEHGPDLVISHWEIDQSKPYFIRVAPGGGNLFVKVTTKNIGDRRAKASVTLLGLTHNGNAVALKEVHVPGLDPNEPNVQSVELHVDELGWMVPEGKANATDAVKNETNVSNNRLHLPHFRVPAIADQWTVDQFETKSVVTGGISSLDTTLTDGTFQLKGWNASSEEWVYDGFGTVEGADTYNPSPLCSGTGTGSDRVSPSTLTTDTLRIARDLNGYTATIATSKLPRYSFTVSCPNPIPISAGYEDLTTVHIGPAFEPMKEDQQTLSGSAPLPITSPGGTSDSTWRFFADI